MLHCAQSDAVLRVTTLRGSSQPLLSLAGSCASPLYLTGLPSDRIAVRRSFIHNPSSIIHRPLGSAARVQQSAFSKQGSAVKNHATVSPERNLNIGIPISVRTVMGREGRGTKENKKAVQMLAKNSDRWTGRQNLDHQAAPASARKCERKGQSLGEISGSFPGSKKQPFFLTPSVTTTYNKQN